MGEMTEPVTLREHLESRISAMDQRHSELAIERNRAVDAALAAAHEKGKAHNDLLAAMKDQQAMFVTKESAGAQFKALTIAIGAVAALVSIIAALVVLAGMD